MGRKRAPDGVLGVFGKLSLVSGGILLAVVSMFASSFHPSPDRIEPVGRRWDLGDLYNLFLDLKQLGQAEPLGGILAVGSICLLLAGAILYFISRRLR